MSCASCVTRVPENALQSVPGVTQARVNLGGAYCAGDGQCLPTRFSAGGGKSGCSAEAIEDDAKRRERRHKPPSLR
ncbi:hypothetical protein ACLB1E_30295 [Escherichia coli]